MSKVVQLHGWVSKTALIQRAVKLFTFTLEESLDGFEKNGEAEGQKEDTVVECSQELGSLPSIRQGRLPLCLGCQLKRDVNKALAISYSRVL